MQRSARLAARITATDSVIELLWTPDTGRICMRANAPITVLSRAVFRPVLLRLPLTLVSNHHRPSQFQLGT